MSDKAKAEFSGAANVSQLGRWLGISRNRVEELSSAFGVLPAGKKFPERRLISGLLGLEVGNADVAPLTFKLMTLAEAAAELGCSAQDLKLKIENGEIDAPPMYVFGERSRRFIRHQFLEFSKDPRGRFQRYAFSPDWLISLQDLARSAGLRPVELEENFAGGRINKPGHVIFEGGQTRFFRVHAEKILGQSNPPKNPAVEPGPSSYGGGLLGQIAATAGPVSKT